KYNPDLVHFPHFNVPISYSEKYVVTIHDLLMHWQKGKDATTLPAPLYFTKRLAYKSIFRKAVRGAEKIIVPSNAVKKEVVSYYNIDPEKICVIYEGVDLSKITDLNVNGLTKRYGLHAPYFIYTGNAYPHKNLERAIKAVVRLNESTKASFAIVSSRNIFTARLEKIIKENNAQDFIRLLGFVPDPELALLYKESVGFLYPSLSEGFGLPGLEAMAAGTVSLVSEIPVFREVYEDRVVYFDPYKFESITSALEKVLNFKAEERRKLILGGQKFIEKYSWEKMVQETLSVYKTAGVL
ncbi:hypothetical protein A2125_01385, partial [Candidatus Woesebacteria bacterium GWB1_43_5]